MLVTLARKLWSLGDREDRIRPETHRLISHLLLLFALCGILTIRALLSAGPVYSPHLAVIHLNIATNPAKTVAVGAAGGCISNADADEGLRQSICTATWQYIPDSSTLRLRADQNLTTLFQAYPNRWGVADHLATASIGMLTMVFMSSIRYHCAWKYTAILFSSSVVIIWTSYLLVISYLHDMERATATAIPSTHLRRGTGLVLETLSFALFNFAAVAWGIIVVPVVREVEAEQRIRRAMWVDDVSGGATSNETARPTEEGANAVEAVAMSPGQQSSTQVGSPYIQKASRTASPSSPRDARARERSHSIASWSSKVSESTHATHELGGYRVGRGAMSSRARGISSGVGAEDLELDDMPSATAIDAEVETPAPPLLGREDSVAYGRPAGGEGSYDRVVRTVPFSPNRNLRRYRSRQL